METLRLTMGLVMGLGLVFGGCSCDDEPSDDMEMGSDASMPDGAAGSGGSNGGAGDGGLADGGGMTAASCLDAMCESAGQSCEEEEGCYFLRLGDANDPDPVCRAHGMADDGEACEHTTDCAAGMACDEGVCRHYCCDLLMQSNCPAGQACQVELTNEDGEGTGIGLCRGCEPCNMLTAEGCDEGDGCYPVTVDSQCTLCQESLEELGEGEPCEVSSECAPGLGCYSVTAGDEEGEQMCTAFCDLTADSDACSDGKSCMDIIGVDDIGLCVTTE